jgi:hypothetical protein
MNLAFDVFGRQHLLDARSLVVSRDRLTSIIQPGK